MSGGPTILLFYICCVSTVSAGTLLQAPQVGQSGDQYHRQIAEVCPLPPLTTRLSARLGDVSVRGNDAIPLGGEVTYDCEPGFRLAEGRTRICQRLNGLRFEWSHPPPICVLIRPSSVTNLPIRLPIPSASPSPLTRSTSPSSYKFQRYLFIIIPVAVVSALLAFTFVGFKIRKQVKQGSIDIAGTNNVEAPVTNNSASLERNANSTVPTSAHLSIENEISSVQGEEIRHEGGYSQHPPSYNDLFTDDEHPPPYAQIIKVAV